MLFSYLLGERMDVRGKARAVTKKICQFDQSTHLIVLEIKVKSNIVLVFQVHYDQSITNNAPYS
jgi:hypothetical protein